MDERLRRSITIFKLINQRFPNNETESQKYMFADELLELMAKANKVHDEKGVNVYGITINTRNVFLMYANSFGDDEKIIRESYNTRRNESIIDALQRILMIYYRKVK